MGSSHRTTPDALPGRAGFDVRTLGEPDLEQVAALFDRAYGFPRDPAYFRWKFLGGADGDGVMSGAFTGDGRLVAHCGAYPVSLLDASGAARHIATGYQVADVMTAPGHRGVGPGTGGLFVRSLRNLIDTSFARGFPFLFGVVVEGSPILRCYERYAEGRTLCRLGYWQRSLGYRWTWKPRRRSSADAVTSATQVDTEWDELLERCGEAYGILVSRSASYVAWRHLSCPEPGSVLLQVREGDRLVGWSAFRRRGTRLLWGDALFDPEAQQAPRRLLAGALQQPAFRGCRTLQAWFPQHPDWWSRQLRDLGLQPAPEPQSLCAIYSCNGASTIAVPEPERLRQRLYYSLADTDLF